jgi:hypothetical protein
VRESVSPVFPQESGRAPGAGEDPVLRGTTEGTPIAALSIRKARQSGDLGPEGQRAHAPQGACLQLPAGPGTGAAVPAATTRSVRDRNVRGEGCSSRRGEGGPSLGAPRGAALDVALSRDSRWRREPRRERASLERIDRSWPVRIARPSCPTARTARTARAGKGRSPRTPRCAARILVRTHECEGPR